MSCQRPSQGNKFECGFALILRAAMRHHCLRFDSKRSCGVEFCNYKFSREGLWNYLVAKSAAFAVLFICRLKESQSFTLTSKRGNRLRLCDAQSKHYFGGWKASGKNLSECGTLRPRLLQGTAPVESQRCEEGLACVVLSIISRISSG